LEAEGMMAIQ